MKSLKDKLFPDMPEAATAEDWDAWDEKSKKEHPIKWFVSDTIPDTFGSYVSWPLERKYSALKQRVSEKRWKIVPRRLDKWQWHETDELVLHSAFELLEEFIIEEKSHMLHWSHDDLPPAKDEKTKIKYAMEYLDWEISLCSKTDLMHSPNCKEDSQSNIAKEAKELFIWWYNERPKRIDPYENEYYAQYTEMRKSRNAPDFTLSHKDDTKEESKIYQKAMDLATELEEQYNKEDDENLIRLMKIRRGLWI